MNASLLAKGVIQRNRRCLARTITKIESSTSQDACDVKEILRELVEYRRKLDLPLRPRIAISGPPGAGKSCFIEALGMFLCEASKSVAVMAVDPSSSITGGSILGDKTRMDHLSMHPQAFIRPSPSGGHLGGVATRCWEVLEVFESANYDVTFVETVGVGQSETHAKQLTDLFVLLLPPAAGDDLQGIKKGIVEVADCVFVTKADGAKEALAQETLACYRNAIHVSRKSAKPPPILAVSAETKPETIRDAWLVIEDLWQTRLQNGEIARQRASQRRTHFEWYFDRALLERARRNLREGSLFEQYLTSVEKRDVTPREAAEEAIARVLK